jgi:hypothetical protein
MEEFDIREIIQRKHVKDQRFTFCFGCFKKVDGLTRADDNYEATIQLVNIPECIFMRIFPLV